MTDITPIVEVLEGILVAVTVTMVGVWLLVAKVLSK